MQLSHRTANANVMYLLNLGKEPKMFFLNVGARSNGVELGFFPPWAIEKMLLHIQSSKS